MKKTALLTVVFMLLAILCVNAYALNPQEIQKRIGSQQQAIQQIIANIKKAQGEIFQRQGVIAAYTEILAELKEEEKLADDEALEKLKDEVEAGKAKIKTDLEKK